MIEQSPPNSPSIERAVLSAMLFDVECIETAAELITEQSFYRPAYALLFRTMVSMYNAGVEVDQLTLAVSDNEILVAGILDQTGDSFKGPVQVLLFPFVTFRRPVEDLPQTMLVGFGQSEKAGTLRAE